MDGVSETFGSLRELYENEGRVTYKAGVTSKLDGMLRGLEGSYGALFRS